MKICEKKLWRDPLGFFLDIYTKMTTVNGALFIVA
jgi:hypothetical protein